MYPNLLHIRNCNLKNKLIVRRASKITWQQFPVSRIIGHLNTRVLHQLIFKYGHFFVNKKVIVGPGGVSIRETNVNDCK